MFASGTPCGKAEEAERRRRGDGGDCGKAELFMCVSPVVTVIITVIITIIIISSSSSSSSSSRSCCDFVAGFLLLDMLCQHFTGLSADFRQNFTLEHLNKRGWPQPSLRTALLGVCDAALVPELVHLGRILKLAIISSMITFTIYLYLSLYIYIYITIISYYYNSYIYIYMYCY